MNGAQKIVGAMKVLSNSNKTPQSQIISATVISTNPLKFQLENRLEIDSSFYELSNLEDWVNVKVGTKVRGFSFNEGQKYYISDIAEDKDYSLASIQQTLQAILNGEIEISGGGGSGLPTGAIVDYIGDTIPDGFELYPESNSGIPIGAGMDYYGVTAPNNFMFCDGTAISRTEYEELFALIGTNYGSGDGKTTFNLPDKREAVTIMKGTTYTTLGQVVGANTKTITKANLPSYTLYDQYHSHNVPVHVSNNGSASGISSEDASKSSGVAYYIASQTARITVNSGGSGTAFNVMQKSLVCNYIIRVK